MRQRTWTDEQLIEAVPKCLSMASVARELGLAPKGGTYKTLKNHITRLSLTTEHFTGQGWNLGFFVPKPAQPLSEILVENSTYTASSNLRQRLLREGVFEPKCYGCDLTAWRNFLLDEEVPVPLELDHINGVNTDNRLENLRLLCPNCHAVTPTYRGKNQKRAKLGGVVQSAGDNLLKRGTVVRSNRPVPTCETCGKKSIGKQCKKCFNGNRASKIEWPSNAELLYRLASSNYSRLARELGVSDNAIRKRLTGLTVVN